MSKLGAWLRLIRVAALPTALADVWLGAAVAGGFGTWSIFWLSLISLALYAAGMILNDVCDVDIDRVENPGRPLPRGEIAVAPARRTGLLFLFGGIVVALLVGSRTASVAAVLALLIVSYNFFLKGTVVGPVNMGLCRACNVALGMSVAAGTAVVTLHALPIFVYVLCVSVLSRYEARRPGLRRIVGLALIGIIPLQALVALICSRPTAAACILALLIPVLLLRKLSLIT